MRIGYVARWRPDVGGGYQYDLCAIAALHDAVPDCRLVVFYSGNSLPNDLGITSERIEFINVKNRMWGSKIISSIASRLVRWLYESANFAPIVYANRALRSHNLDVCVSTAPFVDAIFAGCPSVLIIHDLWFTKNMPGTPIPTLDSEHWRSLRTQIGIWNANAIIVESPCGRDELCKFAPVAPDRIEIVRLPRARMVERFVHTRLASPVELGIPYVFYPAHYLEFKNHKVILRALARLKDDTMRIGAVFCGPVSDRAYRETLVEFRDELGLKQSVIFLDRVSDEMVAALYQNAFVMVMASKCGPTNMPIWEAMSFGVPVISSDVGDMPWQVADAGLLFEPDDDVMLGNHLKQLLASEEMHSSFVDKGKKQAGELNDEAWGRQLWQVLQNAKSHASLMQAAAWRD